ATFQVDDPAKVDEEIATTRRYLEGGKLPEGIPATGFLMLVDREAGKVVEILLFESEESLRRGDETMDSFAPGDGSIHRVSVDGFTVPVRLEQGRPRASLRSAATGRGAAWLARQSGGLEVPGSNPGAPTGNRLRAGLTCSGMDAARSYRFDEFGWLQFDRLCSALLELDSVGWEEREFGRVGLAPDRLLAPGSAVRLEPPTLIVVAWLRAGALRRTRLREVVRSALEEATVRPRSVLVLTNAETDAVAGVPVPIELLGTERLAALLDG